MSRKLTHKISLASIGLIVTLMVLLVGDLGNWISDTHGELAEHASGWFLVLGILAAVSVIGLDLKGE